MAAERRIRKASALLVAFFAPVSLLIFLWPADLATGQSAAAAEHKAAEHQGHDFKISVDVSLVVLRASVRDRRGGFVSELRSENFKVYEDGVPQGIKFFTHKDVPVTVGLIIDNSTSMRPKRGDVMSSALAFARSSNPRDELFLVHFNERAWLGLLPAVTFTGDHDLLEARSIVVFRAERRQTTMPSRWDSITLSGRIFDKKALVVISDGGDNASRRLWPEVRAVAQPRTPSFTPSGWWMKKIPIGTRAS